MNWKRSMAGFTAAVLTAATIVTPAFAAPATTDAIIDTAKTGSFTLHKLVNNDGYNSINDATGHEVSLDNDGNYALTGKDSGADMLPLDDVVFSYKKVASLIQVGGVHENGANNGQHGVGIYFTDLDADYKATLEGLGYNWNADTNKTVISGETYYTTDQMEIALAFANNKTGANPGETILNQFLSEEGVAMNKTDADGKATATGLELGLYLVGETDITAHDGLKADGSVIQESPNPEAPVLDSKASPFYVVLPTTNLTKIGDKAEGTVWIYDVDVFPKNQSNSITKRIVDPDEKPAANANDRTLRVVEDYQIGDTIDQVIYADAPALQPEKVNADPNSSLTKQDKKVRESYIISDVMTEGLTFDSVVRVAYGPKVNNPTKYSDYDNFTDFDAKDYKVTEDIHGKTAPVSGPKGSHKFAVELTASGLAKLNAVTENSEVLVYFKATLNKDAKIGTVKENENHPTLTWKNSNTVEQSYDGNHVYDYTYELDLTKKGVTDASKVGFKVQRHDTLLGATDNVTDVKFVKESDGVYHVFDENHEDSDGSKAVENTDTLHPSSDGKLYVKGLDSNKYTFKEIATEQGKDLLKNTFDVIFTAEDPNRNGTLKTAKAKVVNKDLTGAQKEMETDLVLLENKGIATITVDNYKTITLRTGGEGRTMIYMTGFGLMALLGAVYAVSKKRTA